MSKPSNITYMSTRALRRVLNDIGTLKGAAQYLGCHSSTLSTAINERRINWTPSAHSRSMLKAARTRGDAKTLTSFKKAPRDVMVGESSKGTKNVLTVPENIVRSVVRELILEGRIKVQV